MGQTKSGWALEPKRGVTGGGKPGCHLWSGGSPWLGGPQRTVTDVGETAFVGERNESLDSLGHREESTGVLKGEDWLRFGCHTHSQADNQGKAFIRSARHWVPLVRTGQQPMQ